MGLCLYILKFENKRILSKKWLPEIVLIANFFLSLKYTFTSNHLPREGEIIDWPLKRLFNDAHDVISTLPTKVREMEDNDNDNEPMLGAL